MGSWCNHVRSLTLALPDGSVTTVGPDDDADLFWATAGGMGLTGLILEASFQCLPIETSRLVVDTDRTADLDGVMALMDEGDADYDYSVAFVDLMARGRATGRGVLTRARFARADEVAGPEDAAPPTTTRRCWPRAPPGVPSGLMNRLSVQALNEVWYRKAPARRRDELQTIPTFFHPLDMVDRWFRMYGPRGFLQWQYAVPFGAEELVRHTVAPAQRQRHHHLRGRAQALRAGQPRPLSFPMPGWTLAVDIPVGGRAWVGCSTSWTRPWWPPAAASTWPRTAGCGPSCWAPCTPSWNAGARSAGGSTPTSACAATWPDDWASRKAEAARPEPLDR